jgi:glycyl-tRNA synthetase beta chain
MVLSSSIAPNTPARFPAWCCAAPPTALSGEGGSAPMNDGAAAGELLLELLSEEIPARMQRRAIEDLVTLLRTKLTAAEIPAAAIRGYVTPRRMTVIGEGIPRTQPDRTEERRGPRVGAPQQAIEGFLRAAGLADIAECEVRDTGRGEFYFARLQRTGRNTIEILPELIRAAMAELPWPKSMRYPASAMRWVRPLTSILCLFDGEVPALALDDIPVGRTTSGHRFLAPEPFAVANGADYSRRLADAHVLLDHDARRAKIGKALGRLAAAEGLRVKPDPGLLDEVAGLVEFPVALMGQIDAGFMSLPPEVLATAMRAHQKYFTCLNPDETPAPRFLFVANNKADDGGETIVAGNERVLRARLADARFFWDQDRKTRLEDRVDALKERVFHAKLGSVFDKVRRMEALADYLARPVPGADAVLCRRAARLAKADLSTGMVGEFPELQGVMGRYYALHDGEPVQVADAIADHYRPLGPNDACPTAPESIVVALADKIDSLAAFFAIGEAPTGSRDPFALRRAALGVIRIILENGLRIGLGNAFGTALEAPGEGLVADGQQAGNYAEGLLRFVADRLKVHLREQGVRHDLIAAVFSQFGAAGLVSPGRYEDDLVRLLARVRALEGFLDTEDGTNLLVAYRRASNIVRIEDVKDGHTRGVDVDFGQLVLPAEQALGRSLDDVAAAMKTPLEQEEFDRAMSELAKLRGPIDELFNSVTVNIDEPKLRENRLRLLARIRATMNQVADFSQVEG